MGWLVQGVEYVPVDIYSVLPLTCLIVPSATATIIMTAFAVFALDSTKLAGHGRVDPPDVGVFATLVFGIFGMLVR